jgi:hypothetical protein
MFNSMHTKALQVVGCIHCDAKPSALEMMRLAGEVGWGSGGAARGHLRHLRQLYGLKLHFRQDYALHSVTADAGLFLFWKDLCFERGNFMV